MIQNQSLRGGTTKQSQVLLDSAITSLRYRFVRNDNWAFFYLEYSKIYRVSLNQDITQTLAFSCLFII
jgi:hypothetical protein